MRVALGAEAMNVGPAVPASSGAPKSTWMVGAGRVDADRRVIAVRDLELGGEVVGPVAEQLARRSSRLSCRGWYQLELSERDVVPLEEPGRRGGSARVAVAEVGAMVVVDVPVELDRVFLQLGVGVASSAAGVEALAAWAMRCTSAMSASVTVPLLESGRPAEVGARGALLVLLVVGEEEQLVLQHRTAEGEAVGLLVVEAVKSAAGRRFRRTMLSSR